MIIFDTETTGLIIPGVRDSNKQPRIVEIAAIKVDGDFNIIDRFETLINPQCEIPEEAVKSHGLTLEHLRDAPTFPLVRQAITAFWLGESTVMAYNVAFDLGMLYWELKRIDYELRFPWCYTVVDAIQYRNGKRISLDKWSKEVLGPDYSPQTHRAMGDVERLRNCWRHLMFERGAKQDCE